jgi:hypothetical protein
MISRDAIAATSSPNRIESADRPQNPMSLQSTFGWSDNALYPQKLVQLIGSCDIDGKQAKAHVASGRGMAEKLRTNGHFEA